MTVDRTGPGVVALADTEVGLLGALQDAGIQPTRSFILRPGKISRFTTAGRRGASGWCWCSDDCRIAIGGDWRVGLKVRWQHAALAQATPQDRRRLRAEAAKAVARAETERRQHQAVAASLAQATWAAAAPASPQHPYLVMKKLPPLALRQSGVDLLVPFRSAARGLRTLQTISPDGRKLYLKDGERRGTFCLVGGSLQNAADILIGEGWGTVAAAHLAIDWPAIAAGDAPNLLPVTRMVRRRFPLARIVLLPDWDEPCRQYPEPGGTGVAKAVEAALAINGLVAAPPAEGDGEVDWADRWLRVGAAIVRDELLAALRRPGSED